MSSFWQRHEYRTDPIGLSKRGYVYQANIDRTLGNGATASAQFTTGETPTIIYLRELVSTAENIRFRAWETTATSGVSGSAVGFNLNNTITDSTSTSQAVLSASVTGASVTNNLVTDVIPAGSKTGGAFVCSKVRTLKPNTTYLFELQNLGNNATIAHIGLVWTENEPDPYGPIQ